MMPFILSGCVTLYKPNVINSPMVKEKGEANASGSLGLSGNGLYNLQGAYALKDHVGILANGMYHTRHLQSSDSTNTGSRQLSILFAEAGAGYFTSFGGQKQGLFQCYGGGGYGHTTDRINSGYEPNPQVNAKYFNVFIQPGIAHVSPNFEAAFDVRANYVGVFDINAYLFEQFDWWNTDLHFVGDTAIDFINLEPVITLKAGGRLKGIVQFGMTFPVVHPDSYFATNSSAFMLVPLVKFSMGISYNFGRKKD